MSDTKNQIEQATDLLKSVPEFLQAAQELLQTPWGWIILLTPIFWILKNKDLSKTITLFKNKETKKIEKIEKYINSSEGQDNQILRKMQDLRDAYYFKAATGIYAENKRRHALITLHDQLSHDTHWQRIRNADDHIKINEDGSLFIRKLNLFEIFELTYNFIVFMLLTLFGALVAFTLIYTTDQESLSSIIQRMVLIMICFVTAAFLVKQSIPYLSVLKLRKALKQTESEEEITEEKEKEIGRDERI